MGEGCERVRSITTEMELSTVCDSSQCPNIGKCWSDGRVTFMILGEVCTRDCAFCAVPQGMPQEVDEDEPGRVALAAARLGLDHVVITSVTRDDLPNQGADQFARTVREVRKFCPRARIEVLIPDMNGIKDDIATVVASGPDVVGHNIEVVERLQGVRDRRVSYRTSLLTLRTIRSLDPSVVVKSSIMLGLGESVQEVADALRDLCEAGVDAVTLGQYLRPRGGRLDVVEYVDPSTFDHLALMARGMGFRHVAAAPLVRSSFNAHRLFEEEAHAHR